LILDRIVQSKRESRTAFVPIDSRPRPLLLRPALKVIAEFKRRSPSAGAIAPDADVAAVARGYENAGAAALSVLTDGAFFGGSAEDLQRARAAVALPILRKDFLVDERDVAESRQMGADLVLLIVRILDDARLRSMIEAAHGLGMAALVEAHSDAEIDRALSAGAQIIGVNHRDLDTLAIDLSLSSRARARIGDRILVAESGIKTPDDVRRMRDHGADAILVGEQLMRQPDPGRALEQLCS
jgi:indole-3-glycerol phosphate synthase